MKVTLSRNGNIVINNSVIGNYERDEQGFFCAMFMNRKGFFVHIRGTRDGIRGFIGGNFK